ncbi:MAG: transposase domain-containing protein, partial [Bacteroidetes bacterium]|nr:transposase domain-containing protein [Bacteroidota bacterium]
VLHVDIIIKNPVIKPGINAIINYFILTRVRSTLIANAKHAGVEPYAWLKEVISRIADHPYSKLNNLLHLNMAIDTK